MTRDFIATAAHQLRRLYSKCLPNPCFLCTAPTGDSLLCIACQADLPRLTSGCLRCASPLVDPGICGQCLQKPPPHEQIFCLLPYLSPIDDLIGAYKYHQQLGLRDFFAAQMAAKLKMRDDLPTLILPVPLHKRRLRQRGYNQSADLANRLGQLLNIDVDNHTLKRIRATQPQSELPFKARRKNLRGAFACGDLHGVKHVALIDDVYTTGHTVAEAGRCLQKQGVTRLEVWTIARAIRHY
ncbi:MAG: ComF family protein [Methylophaga sp.]|nr:ComF family protein [Methylophaga sp.]